MEQTGYLTTRPHRPASLAFVIALHAAVLTALVLYRADVLPPINTGIPLIHVDPEAKPIQPEPRHAEKHVVRTNPSRGPVIRTDVSTATKAETSDYVPENVIDRLGDAFGKIALPQDPVRHDPVLVDASLAPGFARTAQPPYPAGLQRAEIEGSVVVRVQIDVDGRVIGVEQVRSDQTEFFTATRDWALRNWRFRPATRDGVPVLSWRTMTVHFRMNA